MTIDSLNDAGQDIPAHALQAGVVRRTSRLADGRELFYYDDAHTTLGPEHAIDARSLAPRPDTPTMRQDVLTGDWISVASARQGRVVLPPAETDPLAPQTPTNPSEVPARYDVAVFENRSPSFGPALALATGSAPPATNPPRGLDDLAQAGLGRTRTSVGRCEVVCFSPDHEGSFGTQTLERARTVIEAWADRTAALSRLPGIQQVFPFENRGEAIGVTLRHPHGQIYAYPYITPRTSRLLEQLTRTGPDLFERILAFEQSGPRVVLRATHFTAFVPFSARWPLEVHVLPHRHVADLAGLTDEERHELARVYLRVLRGIDALYSEPTPYISAWHQSPVNVGRESVRLRLEITSPRRSADKLKFLAGSEAAMGAWIADVLPEESAQRLRAAVDGISL